MFSRIARHVALAIVLFTASFPAIATAQIPQFSLPPQTVVGRSGIGAGPAQAIPFSQLLALMTSGALSIPSVNTNSIVFKGSISGQATVQAQANAGTPTLLLPNTSGTIPSTATSPIVINPVTGAISCPTCSTSTSAASPILASRALAQTLNLSTFTGLTTIGYAASGDGGGATFKNVGAANFIDSFIPTGTGGGSITNAGATCTNGTYLGVLLTGGHGTNARANITVAGTVVTSVTITGTGGNGYQVGDVLGVAASTLGTCTGFAWTVSSITTPTGSFSDSVGTHFQIIIDQGNFINIRQFGAACNWNKTAGDAGSTNDTTSIQNALNFAGAILPPTIDAGGLAGQTVVIPKCYALASALQVPMGVRFISQGPWSGGLKEADSLPASSNFITLCDPTTRLACFGTFLGNMELFPGSGSANSNIAMVYSNNVQEQDTMNGVSIFSGGRACVFFEQGFGGASQVNLNNIYCIPSGINAGIQIALGGSQTLVGLHDITLGAGNLNINGLQITGGFVDVLNFHCEGIVTCIFIGVPVNSGIVGIHNAAGGSGCTDLVVRSNASGNPNMNVAGRLNPNGCTHTINNAGSVTTGFVIADTTF